MKKKLTLFVIFTAALMVAAYHYTGSVGATAASGFTATTLAKGTLGSFDVFNHAVLPPTTTSDDDDKDGGQKYMDIDAKDEGIIRPLRAEQYMGSGREYRVALAPWTQPDHRDGGNAYGLRE